jgi:hypothetical protein
VPKAGPEAAIPAAASLGISGIGYAILRIKRASAFIKANL